MDELQVLWSLTLSDISFVSLFDKYHGRWHYGMVHNFQAITDLCRKCTLLFSKI